MRAMLLQVPKHCIGTYDSIALTHRNAFNLVRSKILSFGKDVKKRLCTQNKFSCITLVLVYFIVCHGNTRNMGDQGKVVAG